MHLGNLGAVGSSFSITGVATDAVTTLPCSARGGSWESTSAGTVTYYVALDAGDPRSGDRPMFFNSLMYNAQMEVTGSSPRAGTLMTSALCAERGETVHSPIAAAPMTEQQIADAAYLKLLIQQ